MSEDWRTCVEQERSYTAGWRERMAGRIKPDEAFPAYWKGWHDADRRLKCPAMYAGYNQRRESHEESTR